MQPLALSDSEVTTIFALARPLSPDQRDIFLQLVAQQLNGRGEIGDGALFRLCRELQRQVF